MVRLLLVMLATVGMVSQAEAQYGCSGSQAVASYGSASDSYGSSGSAAAAPRVGIFGRIAARRAARLASTQAVAQSIVRVAVPAAGNCATGNCALPSAMQFVAPMQECMQCQQLQQFAPVPVPMGPPMVAANQQCNCPCSCEDCICKTQGRAAPAVAEQSAPTKQIKRVPQLISTVPDELLLEVPNELLLDTPTGQEEKHALLASTGLLW